jgi:hypothetical protein
MSYQEKRSIASLFGTVLISLLYGAFIYQKYQEGGANLNGEFHFWASAILLFIPAAVVLKIVIVVVFSIISTITTQEEEPSVTDERDKLVDLKSTRNFFFVFMAGFFLSLLTQVFSQPPSVMFSLILISIFVGGAVLDISDFYYYRRGV